MSGDASGTGTLYVVSTPIGNLEDLSPRARRILGEVAVVAAEDTRHTRELLSAMGLRTPLVSVHEHNERSRLSELLARLRAGEDVALVSDAGAPLVSDPGALVVAEAIAAGLSVVPIPGPSAVLAALTAAGLPAERFLFLGFPPPRAKARERFLEQVRREPGALVLFEGKARILELLAGIEAVLGPRRVAVCRELTKRHEEVLRGTPAHVAARLEDGERLRGEFTVVVEGAPADAGPEAPVSLGDAQGLKAVAAEVARVLGVGRKEAYQALLALKDQGAADPEP